MSEHDKLAVGIDLGTTNSCVAYVDEQGQPKVIPGFGGALTMPSMVCVDERGNLIVGHQAKRRFLTHPQDTIYGAKRLMGRRFGTEEMEDIQSRFFYDIVEGEDREPIVEAGGKAFKLEELSAVMLQQLRDSAQETLGRRIEHAVISVPAYFTQRQREAVRAAGKLAEIDVLRIINEPTAAALAYGFGKRTQQRILVYDLGGGTFDVTILQLFEEVYEVIGTGGDSFLGGIDFDNALVDRFCAVFMAQHDIDLRQDKVALQRLRDAAERAKIDLSTAYETEINLPFLLMRDGKSIDFVYKLTRQEYESLVRPLVIDTLKIVERVLREAKLEKTMIDEVLFVGGMTRVPLVADMITRYFGRPPRKDVHPDEVVALGAAILADAIARNRAGLTLVDVLPVSIGIGVGKGEFRKIINKNTPIPAEKIQVFRTTKDNQSSVTLRIFQGESREAAKNEYLGELRLTGLPPRPAGEVQVEVRFKVDEESILHVGARDSVTKKQVAAQFVTEALVSRERYRADQVVGVGARSALPQDGGGAEGEAQDRRDEISPSAVAQKRKGRFARLWAKLTGKG